MRLFPTFKPGMCSRSQRPRSPNYGLESESPIWENCILSLALCGFGRVKFLPVVIRQACPAMTPLCCKFYWNPSTKYRDIISSLSMQSVHHTTSPASRSQSLGFLVPESEYLNKIRTASPHHCFKPSLNLHDVTDRTWTTSIVSWTLHGLISKLT